MQNEPQKDIVSVGNASSDSENDLEHEEVLSTIRHVAVVRCTLAQPIQSTSDASAVWCETRAYVVYPDPYPITHDNSVWRSSYLNHSTFFGSSNVGLKTKEKVRKNLSFPHSKSNTLCIN